MRILIIEDEYNLADVLASTLRKEKYLVDISLDGEEGLENALSNIYDLIMLDVMLPKKNGFEILKELKENNIQSKIIMLTAKSDIEDKLEGLTNGAVDYITKPFHIEEVIARVNIQLKKETEIKNKTLIFNDLVLDLNKSSLKSNITNKEVSLVCKEYQLLEYLMHNSNQILSKDQIYEKVWGLESENESNTFEAYLSFLRKKMKAINSNVTIKSIRGLGYKMEAINEKITK